MISDLAEKTFIRPMQVVLVFVVLVDLQCQLMKSVVDVLGPQAKYREWKRKHADLHDASCCTMQIDTARHYIL